MQAGLRELAVQVSRIAEDAGKHALNGPAHAEGSGDAEHGAA